MSTQPTLLFTDPTVRDAAHITYLISSLNRGNVAPLSAELRQRTSTPEAFRFAINKLAVDVLSRKDADQVKQQVLGLQLQQALEQPAYITLLADMLDGIPASVPAVAISDLLVKQLRLKPRDLLAVCVALCFSSSPEGEATGLKVLALRLKEYEGRVSELISVLSADAQGEELLQHIVLLPQPDASCKALLESLRTQRAVPVGIKNVEVKTVDQVISCTTKGMSLAGVMEELGTPCCATPDDCRALFSIFAFLDVTPKAIAECMALFASASAPITETGYWKALLRGVSNARASLPAPPADALRTWNTTAFVAVVKEVAPKLSWPDCIGALDYPTCRIDKFTTVSAIYKKATEQALPVRLFIGQWDNAGVQAAALRWILANPSLCNAIEITPSDLLFNFQAPPELNVHWRSVGFLQSVIHTAAVDKDAEVCLWQAMQKAPAVLFAGLVLSKQVSPQQLLTYALSILRESGSTIVTKQLVDLAEQEDALKFLIALIAELALDPVRVNEAMECYAKNGLLTRAFEVVTTAKIAAHIAIKAVATEQWPQNWFSAAIDDDSVTSKWSFTRYSFAAALVEVCDELLSQTPPQASEGTAAALSGVVGSKVAVVLSSVANHAKNLRTAGEGAADSFSEELEKEATDYLKRMYASDGSDAILDKAPMLWASPKQSDRELCQCIVHVLWQEATCVTEYPKKILIIAARLFGKFINTPGLLPQPKLQYGLRVVLQALMKPTDGKVLEFGIQALEQFKSRVTEWPQYCNALKGIPDLDMHVPGIMATISKCGIGGAASGRPSPAPSGAVTGGNGPTGGTSSPPPSANNGGGMHQHDIRILMSRTAAEATAPPEVVQNRINFLVGNTDNSNLQTSAAELRELLKPEYYPYFADYLVVKRVSLEANHHRMYLSLLESLEAPSLFPRIRTATYDAIRRLLSSERIRANSSERTLLKNLGSWLGLLTLARNLPVLARDLDFKQLLQEGLRTGRLIAVVPLMAKVIEQAAQPSSRIFRPPNPWLMSQLGHLMELYQLPDLKMTLRFEIEVLLKNLGLTAADVPDTSRTYYSAISMAEIRRTLDVSNSTDFRLDESGGSPPPSTGTPTPAPAGETVPSRLRDVAKPFFPRDGEGSAVGGAPAGSPSTPMPAASSVQVVPPRHTVRISAETVKFGSDLTQLPAAVRAPYRQALPQLLERACTDLSSAIDRSALIAVTATREVVVKDFTRDPDDLRMRRAAQQMVRSLASALCNVSARDVSRPALRKVLVAALPQYFQDPQAQLEALADGIMRENMDLVVSFLVGETIDRASRKMEEVLVPIIEERTRAKAHNEFPIIPADQQRVAQILSTLPESLRPHSLQRQHNMVYNDFAPRDSDETAVEEVVYLLQQIEEAAKRHYDNPQAVPLSLTSSSFTEATHGEHHLTIKNKLLEVAHLITESNALALASTVFPRLMALADLIAQNQRNPLNALLNEVCLFVLQTARERSQAKVVPELTKRYLDSPRCFFLKDVATNFLRLRLMDIAEFDRRLAVALRDEQVAGTGRTTVEFAGHVVQRCLIDDKLTSAKEMRQTLQTLEEIARARKAAQAQAAQQNAQSAAAPAAAPAVGSAAAAAQPAATAAEPVNPAIAALSPSLRRASAVRIPTLHGPEHRQAVKSILADWMRICLQRHEIQPSTPGAPSVTPEQQRQAAQQQSMVYVQRLQQEGWLKPEQGMLDKFLGICMDLAVEDYATQALNLVRAGGDPNDALNAAIVPDSKIVQPPPYRYRSDLRLFATVDAVADLVVLLARCCGWNAGARNDGTSTRATVQAESALITKVLHVVSKVLVHNHDYFVAQQRPPPPPLAEGEAQQEEFMQQPYVRFFSNILIALNPPPPLDGSAPPPLENVLIIASALHLNNPQRVPGFAFGWLELISHRVFVSRILKAQQGWHAYSRVYCDALRFMDLFISSKVDPLSPAFLLFFKSVFKLSLLLLHDFGDFVLAFHQPLLDAIPLPCIQLRNVILSAFPRNVRLPDPFGGGFRLDQMVEVTQSPPIADSVRDFLKDHAIINRDEVQAFVRNHAPANFAQVILPKLRNPSTGAYDIPLLSNFVLTMGVQTLDNLALQPNSNVLETPAAECFKQLAVLLDNQGRYLLFTAFANQLRYPNNQTHLFSLLLLHLFEADHGSMSEVVQEQIVRVLVERVLVVRPHPWGLLITFLELVRNPKYNFWTKPFIKCSPAVEQTFDQVARSIKQSTTAASAAAAAQAQPQPASTSLSAAPAPPAPRQ